MDEDFAVADADAALTVPIRAGELKKGSLIVMDRNKPCKIVEYSTSKTGKHGHAKAKYAALDIFTGKRYEDAQPTSHNVEAPVVERRDYLLIGVSPDGFASLLDLESGAIDASLPLPAPAHLRCNTEEEEAAYKALEASVRDGEEVHVTVLSAMGHSAILPTRALVSFM